MSKNKEEDKDIIKVKFTAKIGKVFYPKAPETIGPNHPFGIVSWAVQNVEEGEPVIHEVYGTITVKGTYGNTLDKNTVYTIVAKEQDSKEWGKEYELLYYTGHVDLSTIQNQKMFLSSFLTQAQISNLYKTYDDPIKYIENHDREALMKVHGIGPAYSYLIIERFEANRDKALIYSELGDYNFSYNFINKLIARYKNPIDVVNAVKKTPYKLCEDIDGVGFKTADNIALKVGIDERSIERIKAFIVYTLKEQAELGNSYVTSGVLTKMIFDAFDGKENILEFYYNDNNEIIGNNVGSAMDELQEKGLIVIEDNESKSKRRVYLKKFHQLELQVAEHLNRIANAQNNFVYDDWEEVIRTQENKQGWAFTDEQKRGIKLGLDNQVCFITGLGGTGKTALVAGILACLHKYSFAQCALAGKASARMQEVTGAEGYTIHRLLGYKPPYGFERNEDNPLLFDIIILDELSLVGGQIFLSLLKAISNGTKLIMLGDMGQLESIGCMNLAADIYKSKSIATVELTKIHRQAQKSGIITASHKIREGIPVLPSRFTGVEVVGELQDMIFDVESTNETTLKRVMKWFKEKYHGDIVKEDIMNIQVLCPCKERGEASVLNINLEIQKYINPSDIYKEEFSIASNKSKPVVLREGDKIMIIKNNYKVMGDRHDTGVFNGWNGILRKINYETEMAEIYIPMIYDTVYYPLKDVYNEVILGYASTIHKYQGSSAPVIIGTFDSTTPPMMQTRELLYTLWTRAEKECIMVAQNFIMHNAAFNSGVSIKDTFLTEMLDEGLENLEEQKEEIIEDFEF